MIDIEYRDEAVARARVIELAAAVDRELNADRQFFARHRSRQYRVRRAGRAEAETQALMFGGEWPLPYKIANYFAIVKRLKHGVFARSFVMARRDYSSVQSDEALAIWFKGMREETILCNDADVAVAFDAARSERSE